MALSMSPACRALFPLSFNDSSLWSWVWIGTTHLWSLHPLSTWERKGVSLRHNLSMRLSWPIVVLCGLLISIMFIPQDVARSYISALLQWISGLGTQLPFSFPNNRRLGCPCRVGNYTHCCCSILLSCNNSVWMGCRFPVWPLRWVEFTPTNSRLPLRVLLVTFSKTLGGSLGFVAGRTMLRDWVAEKLASHPSFQNALQTMKEDGRPC